MGTPDISIFQVTLIFRYLIYFQITSNFDFEQILICNPGSLLEVPQRNRRAPPLRHGGRAGGEQASAHREDRLRRRRALCFVELRLRTDFVLTLIFVSNVWKTIF